MGDAMAEHRIDRDKFRVALRSMRKEDLFHMLGKAIGLLEEEYEIGYGGGGHPNWLLRIRPKELVRVTGAATAPLSL
jgi:hypothetical protein